MGCVFSGRAKAIIRPRSASEQLAFPKGHLEPSAGGSTGILMMNSLAARAASVNGEKNDKLSPGNKPSIFSMLMRQSANQVESHFAGTKEVASRLQAGSVSPAPNQKQFQSRKRKLQVSSCAPEAAKMTNNNKTLATEHTVKPVKHSQVNMADEEGGDATLFTSIQQLCHEVVGKRLLMVDDRQGHSECKVLCLFLFGRPGSSKGELAFELVQHSPLLGALSCKQADRLDEPSPCPLYHHLDVAAIIVANLDARIREYNQLVANTMAAKQRRSISPQELQAECDEGSGVDSSNENNRRSSASSSPSSSSSETSDNDSNCDQDESVAKDSGSDLGTLSTKQRSILQLKLMKYFNSVTSKWVFGLIEAEVDKLEAQLRCQRPELYEHLSRIYLINFVPNQPSLFKSCLFLHQYPHLKEFKYPIWAMHFERRTNIKLLLKKRPLEGEESVANTGESIQVPKASSPLPNLSLSGFKFSILSPKSTSKNTPLNQQHRAEQDLRAIAGNLLIEGLNEKLGPKFNDQFAQHFKSVHRLVHVRYNPLRDYNYAHHDESEESFDQNNTCSSQIHKHRISCAKYLHNRRVKLHDTKMQTIRPTGGRQLSSSMQSLSMPRDEQSGFQRHRPSLATGDSLLLSPVPQASSSMSSIISSISSGDSLLSDYSKGRPTGDISHKWTRPTAIKWAVELQLFDSSASHNQNGQDLVTSQSLASYQDPRTVRSSSRSPLMLVTSPLSHQQRATHGGSSASSAYHLVLIRVAYANEQSQVLLELQRVHTRPVKLKSGSDLVRLSKLVHSVSKQLASDCDGWLRDTLMDNESREQHSRDNHIMRRKHSIGSNHLTNDERQGNQPTLIVYTIRLDVARLRLGTFRYPSDFNVVSANKPAPVDQNLKPHLSNRPVPILTLDRPASAMEQKQSVSLAEDSVASSSCIKQRPSSSRSAQMDRPKRHVQFNLSQAPLANQTGLNDTKDVEILNLSSQRRRWISHSIFASNLARDATINRLVDELVALVKWAKVIEVD